MKKIIITILFFFVAATFIQPVCCYAAADMTGRDEQDIKEVIESANDAPLSSAEYLVVNIEEKNIAKSEGIAESPIEEVTLMTHDSFSVSEEVVKDFEVQNNAKIRFLKAGDAGEALNKAILSKNNPLADIFYGVDNTFLSRSLKEEIFISYESPMLKYVDDKLKLDPEYRLLPVDFGDVCLNYDKRWFANHNIQPPLMLEDLVKPEYKGLLVIQNPATSSPGLAFLLTTISRFGEREAFNFWKKLKVNDILVANGWKDAYWGKFSAASDGDRPIVVSYASSPAAEVHFAEKNLEEAPTDVVTSHGSAFRQIEFAGILKGTKHHNLAKKLMDFLLSRRFQEDIPLQMFVFPANNSAILPDVFKKHAHITKEPALLPYDEISEKREMWIEKWTELVL
ncbi:TbpA Thiamine-binding periplasmic protein [Desulfamplus magnetovallimortis]|uniref:TbpA Thiamine-binding periplasmic protein n=1 Tax=Desulfamplus magnetovallimortis TaxID=1246637 RepID=A0A1W1H4H5_9BACT|nr:thiamine ABC transporter substrate-binding protein [Desulfamplus magnetovallimortis]SLM27344.1 TbpA Thiamine-binding periplasmic protein [Desulfamplus magnetovallimortis]